MTVAKDERPSTRSRREPAQTHKQLPVAARDGLMRAWLTVLRQRHPNVTWIPAKDHAHHSDHADETELADSA